MASIMLMLVISSTVATPNEVQGEFAISGGTLTGIFSFLGVPGWVVSIVKGATIVYADNSRGGYFDVFWAVDPASQAVNFVTAKVYGGLILLSKTR
ncbi:hypothetical protein ACYCS5_25315 [Paenibacillus sp. SEL3]